MIVRILFFILIVIAGCVAPTIVFAAAALLYALRYTAYELLVLAACIDGYYALEGTMLPYYTLSFCAGMLFLEWIKPQVRAY